MIKINLLGDSTKIDHTNRYIVFSFVILALLVIGACYRLYDQSTGTVSNLTAEVTNLEEKLAGLKKRTAVVKDLEANKELIRQKLLVLAKLKKNRSGPVKVLDELNVAIPETIWVSSIEEGGTSLSLTGKALDNQNIAMLIQNLQASPYFDNIDLVESKQMYYSKITGNITSTPDTDGRASTGNVNRRQSASSRRGLISENNIRIKEFVIKASINYLGSVSDDQSDLEISDDIELPQLQELEKL